MRREIQSERTWQPLDEKRAYGMHLWNEYWWYVTGLSGIYGLMSVWSNSLNRDCGGWWNSWELETGIRVSLCAVWAAELWGLWTQLYITVLFCLLSSVCCFPPQCDSLFGMLLVECPLDVSFSWQPSVCSYYTELALHSPNNWIVNRQKSPNRL